MNFDSAFHNDDESKTCEREQRKETADGFNRDASREKVVFFMHKNSCETRKSSLNDMT